MSEADAEDRLGVIHADHLPHVADGGLAELRITGAVADEQTIKIWRRQVEKSVLGLINVNLSCGGCRPGLQLHILSWVQTEPWSRQSLGRLTFQILVLKASSYMFLLFPKRL